MPFGESSSSPVEAIASEIVDAAIEVHRTLGPGLLESVYERCLVYELTKRRLKVAQQVILPVVYDGVELDSGLRLDIVVENLVIIEVKSVEKLIPLFDAQVLTYLKLSGPTLAFLLNFNVELMKQGIKRIVQSTNHQ